MKQQRSPRHLPLPHMLGLAMPRLISDAPQLQGPPVLVQPPPEGGDGHPPALDPPILGITRFCHSPMHLGPTEPRHHNYNYWT